MPVHPIYACKQASHTATSHQNSVGHTVCIYINSAFLLPVLCRTHSRIYEGEFNDGDFILRINVYVHLAKSADPGQAPQLRYNVGPGYSLFAFLLSWYILRSDAIYVGRQTMVFTECKLKFSPLFYQFIKQNRLRPGTARCNTWIVSNQTVQTLIK